MAEEILTDVTDKETHEQSLQYCVLIETMKLNPKVINGTTGMLFLNMTTPFFMLRNGFVFYALNHPNTIISVAVRKYDGPKTTIIPKVLPYNLAAQLPLRFFKTSNSHSLTDRLAVMCECDIIGRLIFDLSEQATHENRKRMVDRIYSRLCSSGYNIVQTDPVDIFITAFFSSRASGFFDILSRALLGRFLPDLGSKTNWVYKSMQETLRDKCYHNVKIVQQVFSSSTF